LAVGVKGGEKIFEAVNGAEILGPSLRWGDGGCGKNLRHPSAGWDPEFQVERGYSRFGVSWQS
jgi:hypothetical protein